MKTDSIHSGVWKAGCALALLILCGIASARAADPQGALRLTAKADSTTSAGALLDPAHAAWAKCPDQKIHLNRTPPLYAGDPTDDAARPAATVRMARVAGGAVVMRAHWSDATEDQAGGGTRLKDVGDAHIYRPKTAKTNAFADGFCAMAPVTRGPSAKYPSIMMGDPKNPVEMYYWRAGTDFQVLAGHGRATTARPVANKPAAPAQGRAMREGDGWTLTLALPDMKPGTPLSFAIWDGAKSQRDGLKYFSVWYEVQ